MKGLTEQGGEDFPTGTNADALAYFSSRNVLEKVPRGFYFVCAYMGHICIFLLNLNKVI